MKSGSKVKAWFEKLIKDLRAILDKAYNILKSQKSWEQMELIRNNKQTLDMIADYYFEGMEGTKGKAANKNSTSYSLKYDIFGTPFVQVEEDILSGVPKNKWIKTVNAELSRRFPNGIKVGNNVISINNRSRREMTFSEYSKWLMRSEPSLFADKLRAVSNADDVIFASRDYVNEALKHPRKDNIREFARGSVNLRIGNNDYSAEVVVGTTKGEAMLLYDILDLQPIQIKTKKDAATSKRQNAARRNATSKYNMPQSSENVKLSAKDSGADIREVNPMEITPPNRVTSSNKYHFIQIFDYQRMLGSRRGLPPFKEVKYRPCRRGVYTVKQLTVKAFACFKAFLSAFRFTLAVYTQHICGIIPKKIRRNAGGTFHSCGQYFLHRHGLRLFAGNNLLELRDKAKQRAVLINLQQIAYLHCVPAFARYFALLRQIFI